MVTARQTRVQKLEKVTSFKLLGAILSKDGTSTAEVRIRVTMAKATNASLIRLLTSVSISFIHQVKALKVTRTPNPTVCFTGTRNAIAASVT
ncbi:hypothetical protein DPMN_183616 [Dreissena polymorpha]|uniref:Uncharacterized protein n=1 Tax=Dreissena polymorpha TaxID=45954 RepID=A0A9D4I5M1_DREPO|nr:hypothetical protein DPMN_183616 [Dreissena polymorpha]